MLEGPLSSQGPGSPSGVREGDPRGAEPSGCLWVQEKSRLVVIEVKTVSCHFGRRGPPRPSMDPQAGRRPRRPADCPFGPGPGSPESPAPRAWGPRVLQEATNRGTGPPAQPRPREQEKRKAASQEREAKDTERKRRKAGAGAGSRSPPGGPRSPPVRPQPRPAPPGPGPAPRWPPWRLERPRPSVRTPRPAVQPWWGPGPGRPGAWGWGRPPGPPSYEAHLLLRGSAGPPPRRRGDRPPPYVPPPSYHGPHRTLAGPSAADPPRPSNATAPASRHGPKKKLDPRIYRDVLGAWGARPGVGPKPASSGGPVEAAPAQRDRPPPARPGPAPGPEPDARGGAGAGAGPSAPRPLPRARSAAGGPGVAGGSGAAGGSGPSDQGRAARLPRAWVPGPAGQPPRYSQTLPRPWAPGGTGGAGGTPEPLPRGREPRRPHTLPRARGRPRGPDGVFVIDATCVVIRAQYIPPPRARRIPPPRDHRVPPPDPQPHLPPAPRDGGPVPPVPPARRPPRTEEAEAGPAFPSPCQKLLQSGPLTHQAGGGCPAEPGGCPEEAAPGERAARIPGAVAPGWSPAGPGRAALGGAGAVLLGRRLAGPGPYGGALREAVSRIRRHTAPDSDSDEGPERAAPGGSSDGSDTEPAGPRAGASGGTGETEARGGQELGRRSRQVLRGLSRTEEDFLGPAAAGPAPEGQGKPH